MDPAAATRSLLVIGLTGGIGSGKSAAADAFAERGATVVDTDVIAHALSAPGGRAIEALRAAFGDDCIDASGALDRAWMRARAFADSQARKTLEGILHPMIRAESAERVRAATGAYAVLVVPLLIESGTYRSRVHRVLVIDCPEALQIARVRARNGFAEAEIRRILAAQATREARLAAADDVIVNDGTLAALHAEVDRLDARYRRLAATV